MRNSSHGKFRPFSQGKFATVTIFNLLTVLYVNGMCTSCCKGNIFFSAVRSIMCACHDPLHFTSCQTENGHLSLLAWSKGERERRRLLAVWTGISLCNISIPNKSSAFTTVLARASSKQTNLSVCTQCFRLSLSQCQSSWSALVCLFFSLVDVVAVHMQSCEVFKKKYIVHTYYGVLIVYSTYCYVLLFVIYTRHFWEMFFHISLLQK